MNHKASSMETWNAIAYGKSLRPVWFPRMRFWRLGFRCRGVEKSSGFSGRVAPHLCAPRRALAGFLCFFHAAQHFAVRRPSPAWAAAGNQTTQRTRSTAFPELRQPPETAASFSGTRRASRRHMLGQAARWSRGAAAAALLCLYSTPSPVFSQRTPFDTDLNQNKNFIFYFCFVSQNVSSKECKTLKTNLAFLAFSSAGCLKPKPLFSNAGSSLFLLHRYGLYKGILFPFQINFICMPIHH